MKVDRRGFLRSMVGLMLVTAGCGCPSRRIPLVEWTRPTGLTPLALQRVDQQRSIPLVFDVHAHLFNATDIPVKEFLKKSVAHSQPAPYALAIRLLADFIERDTQSLAPSCGEEMTKLAYLLDHSKGFSKSSDEQDLRNKIDTDISDYTDKFAESLIRSLPGSEFGAALDRLDQEFEAAQYNKDSRTPPPTSVAPLSRNPERIREILNQAASPHSFKQQKGADSGGESESLGILRLYRCLQSPRHHNLRVFQKAYSEDNGTFNVDVCFAALVDFDHWLGCPETASSLYDQVLLHEQLAVLSGGYVLPLVPYNPLTDLRQNNKSFNLVRQAIEERGFVGVKLYPPMGYLPLNNSKRLPSELANIGLSRGDAENLDIRLKELYQWCTSVGVPVMAHTGHTMGQDTAYDGMSRPDLWREVQRAYPGFRFNAGHFGGHHQTTGQRPVNWPEEFASLMNDKEGLNFNADLGHLEELVGCTSEEAKRMLRLLQDKPERLKHLMYGSDWHMLSQVSNWENYAPEMNAFLACLGGPNLNVVQRHVFYENAARCFGLRDKEPNRKRLMRFYAKWKMATPSWLEVLDRIQPEP